MAGRSGDPQRLFPCPIEHEHEYEYEYEYEYDQDEAAPRALTAS